MGPRAGLDRCGNLAPTGIRSPDRLARSQSLYRLSYPAHILVGTFHQIKKKFIFQFGAGESAKCVFVCVQTLDCRGPRVTYLNCVQQ